MKKPSSSLYALLCCLAIMPLVFYNCAVIPTCPGNLLPVVEVQVNNSASNHDDYGSTSSRTVCRARITNVNKFGGGLNFPGGVQVEIRNPNSTSNLSYSATIGGALSGSIFVTLPGNGDWFSFYLQGNSSSATDKSSAVELATAGATCNEVALGRKPLMIPSGAAPISPSAALPRVEIEVGSIATLDDYVTWAPTSCRIRWTGGTPPATINITLRNMPGTNRLRFANSSLAGGSTATNATLPLTLNADGTWVQFFVAGNFGNASQADKDAIIEVLDGSSNLLTREGIMVRIRKNANGLTAAERDRYLEALKKLDLTYDDYIDFVRTHSRDVTGSVGDIVAHRQAHSGSGFLPWHRAFVLHIERLLQAADPAVSLHYWKFDSNAPNIFTPEFLGSNSPTNMVTLAATNPIVSWTLPGEGVATGIQRKTPYGDGGHPTVANDTETLALGGPTFPYSSFKEMEVSTHNPAHSTSGANSWVGGSPAIATRDPIFFFLHCNVDRLWARWQWSRTRYQVTDVLTYDLLGSHAAPGPGIPAPSVTANLSVNRTLGQYADDSMWPWDNVTGGAGTAARPTIAILTPFPITLGGILPLAKPTVKGTIDYLTITGTSPGTGLGFAYDDFFPY